MRKALTECAERQQNAGEERDRKPRGFVEIDSGRCKGCGYCVEFCPLGVLVMSPKFNDKGYHFPAVADGTKCSGCDLCGMYCPDFAIHGTRVARTAPAKE